MLSDEPITIGKLTVQNRLVMPPMQTNKTDEGHVTDELIAYYRERAVGSKPGIIVCVIVFKHVNIRLLEFYCAFSRT